MASDLTTMMADWESSGCPEDPVVCQIFGDPNCTCDGGPQDNPIFPDRILHTELWIYSILSVLSLLGNGTFVVVIWKSRKLHTVTHLLMTNLGVANLAFVILSAPLFTSRYILQSEWSLGTLVCKLSLSAVHLSATASFYAIAAVAVDRWLAVFTPGARLSKGKSLGLTGALWAVSLAVAAPYVYVASVERDDLRGRLSCKIACVSCLKTLEVVTVGVQYVVPLAFIVPSYVSLAVYLARKKEVGSEERKRRAHARKSKIIGVLMAIMVVFTLAWTPLLLLSLLMVYRLWIPSLQSFVWCFMGASAGVALTPFLYMLNDSFRQQLWRVFLRCRRLGAKSPLSRSAGVCEDTTAPLRQSPSRSAPPTAHSVVPRSPYLPRLIAQDRAHHVGTEL